MKKKKIAFIIVGVLLLGFAIWNILWYMHYNRYKQLRNKMESETIAGETSYVIRKDNYLFSLVMPTYLHFNGNLAADKTVPGNENSEISMLGWLSIFSNDEYGIILYSNDGYSYQINMDNSGNPIFENNEEKSYIDEITNLVEENSNIISEAYSEWDSVFGLT